MLQLPNIKIISDSEGCANTLFNFKAESSYNDSLQWHWNFNNGSTATGSIVHTIFNSGMYNIVLTVNNETGCTNNLYHKILIISPNINAGNDTSICENSTLQLQGTGAISYIWKGNDLNCNNCQFPKITIDSAESYLVTGTDVNGCTGNDSIHIAIVKPIKVKVFNDDTLCVGDRIQLTVSGANTYKWIPSLFLDNSNLAQPVFSALRDTSINIK